MTQINNEVKGNKDDSDTYVVLNDLSINNAEYFKSDGSTVGKGLYTANLSIINHLENLKPLVDYFRRIYPLYDYDVDTPGNGYRSYVMMVDYMVVYGVKISRQICINRNSYFFRKGTALKELEAVEQGLGSLCLMLTHLQVLVEWSDTGCLYPRDEHPPEELLARAHNLNQYCFYGRCLGFQFCESMQTILKGLGILMASFSELYYNSNANMIGRATSSLWNSSKYLLNPELRAKRIVNISQYASVNFCKQFWFLGEMETMKRLPNFVSPSVVMNKIIVIPPEPMTVEKLDGTTLQVPIPSSHVGPSPLSVRLMSSVKREGMVGEANSKNLLPPSESLFFHCHGGGFVAQSSRSHETYLCQWAKAIDSPILSVDYSLAPEAPFPRALEETFYAYCWALNHLNILGSTGKRIVAGGDSAGGNLVLGLTIKCIMEGIRPPEGLFLAYVPVIVSIIPSPARLLCLMDPLLPLGFLTGCLRAYACTPEAYEAAVKGFEDKLRHQSKKSVSGAATTAASGKTSQFYVSTQPEEDEVGVDTLKESEGTTVNNTNVSNGNVEINVVQETDTKDKHINGNTVTENGKNCNGNEYNDYVSGFLNKYVNNGSLGTVPNSNVLNGISLEGNETTGKENGTFVDAPIKSVDHSIDGAVPQVDETIVNGNSKANTGHLNNLTSAISNTFTTVASGTNGTDEIVTDTVPQNNSDQSTSANNIIEDFEEVTLPCPLEMLKFEVPHNPLLSPYYADDSILSKFPPVSFVTLHMDPCLDDCVEFAKKLRRLDGNVTLDIFEGLPHGFLNFSLLSKEAYEGSKKCTDRIKALLTGAPLVAGVEVAEEVKTD